MIPSFIYSIDCSKLSHSLAQMFHNLIFDQRSHIFCLCFFSDAPWTAEILSRCWDVMQRMVFSPCYSQMSDWNIILEGLGKNPGQYPSHCQNSKIIHKFSLPELTFVTQWVKLFTYLLCHLNFDWRILSQRSFWLLCGGVGGNALIIIWSFNLDTKPCMMGTKI